MIGLLLVTHAPLGSAFIAAATHVFRAQPEYLEAIDVVADQDVNLIHQSVKQAIARLDQGAGVLIMSDIMGATPSNSCLKMGHSGRVEVISGLSLPMLLRALTYRHDALDVTMKMALAGAQNGAVWVNKHVD